MTRFAALCATEPMSEALSLHEDSGTDPQPLLRHFARHPSPQQTPAHHFFL